MRVVIDHDRCAGSGLCVLTDSTVFDQNDEDGRVRLLVAEPDEAARRSVEEAAGVCPSQAISIESS
ncbi:ferredoxin [Amycolatopsis aidingensis]|uniref:ferredoxin n=1 Tax=Amycolatopsis aidingensis TaxID=2842453 RepID=UPI001C0AF8E4|nr:ferredoxin [Amycolatopsis aidingensis]